MTPAWLRPRAEADLIDRARYYRAAGLDVLGTRFFDAALASLRSVERTPSIGSVSLGELCEISGLRSWPIKGFPLRWYCFVAHEHLDVVRLLADRQDLLALLNGDELL